MDWREADCYLDEAKSDIGRIQSRILDSENRFRDPAALDAVYLLSSILDLLEQAQSMTERVSDKTWQATP